MAVLSAEAHIQQDGGDCEVVKVEGKTVTLELKGACGSCPYAMETLKGYVQENLRETVDPEITVERVVAEGQM